MTETTLECMARAAYEVHPSVLRVWPLVGVPGGGCASEPKPWDNLSSDEREEVLQAQRAALQSLRTPSHEITAASVKPGDDRSKAVLDFRAMIDAILEEKP